MKQFLSLAICVLSIMGVSAQNYSTLRDTIWGCRYFATDPATGQPTQTGSKNQKSSLSWPSKRGLEVNYYVRIPKGYARADVYYISNYAKSVQMNVTVTQTDINKVIYSGQVVTPRSISTSESCIELIPATYFATDTWYQIKLVTDNGSTSLRSLSKIIFQREGTERVVSPTVFMAPSAHHGSWDSTDPDAPKDNAYDWVYGEFMYPDEYAFPNRYLMCLGGGGYYSGIQVCGSELRNSALFSAWDNGDTDKNPDLPAYLRSGAVDHNSDVKINRFGNEGTGIQSMMSNAHWKRNHWVQWLLNARPETTIVTLKDKDGNDTQTSYSNTILTAWYKMADDPEWHYISTIRQSGTTHLFGEQGEYSFLENYTDFGGDNYVKCYMKNRYYRSAGTGKWYNRNHITPSHYDYNDGARECRYDYGHGAAKEYENCFYIEHGGFGQVNDGNMYVPLPANTECVDTINIDEKYQRINLAFRNNYSKSITHTLDSLDKTVAGKIEIVNMAKDLIEKEGEIGGFSAEALADLKDAYNNGEPESIAQISTAIANMAQNYNEIRYANVLAKNHIGSQRAYIFQHTDSIGLLYAEMANGKPMLKVGPKKRDDMSANWVIVRSDKYNIVTIYNIGLGLFINFDAENLLSSEPQNIAAFGRWGKGFYIGKNTTTAINVTPEGDISIGKNTAANALFLLQDNLSFTPSTAQIKDVIAQSEASGVLEEYKAMAPNILEMPEGVVGSWTNQSEIERLRELYNDGNIEADKTYELKELIDNAQKITLDPQNSGVFVVASSVEANQDTPFLTIDADNYIYHKAATNKPDQVWFAKPQNGGHVFTSQGRALNSLSDNPGTTIQTKETANGVAFYLSNLGGGRYNLGNVQYGPTSIGGSNNPLKTYSSESANEGWYLTPAKEVRMSLNSVGTSSLFLDFDVTIPEGLEAYTLTGFNENGPLLEQVFDTIHAQTPVILRGTGYGNYAFGIIAEQNYPSAEHIMQGTLLKKSGLKSKTFYTITTKSGKPAIALTLGSSVGANQCYILKETMEALNLNESQYIIDFDNLTAVGDATKDQPQATSGKAYDLQGRETAPDSQGIIIKNHQKVINRK